MDNFDPTAFDQETDRILQIMRKTNEQHDAEERARFEIAMERAAADYQGHCRRVRRRFHAMNQLCLVLAGACLSTTVYFCLTNGGWYSLLSVVVSSSFWALGKWCLYKSRSRREGA